MVTVKNLNNKIYGLLTALDEAGFTPRKAILFGSYAKGTPRTESDIDLAVWAEGFTGSGLIDIDNISSILSRFHPIELHPFSPGEIAADNPFIAEIEQTGIEYSLDDIQVR